MHIYIIKYSLIFIVTRIRFTSGELSEGLFRYLGNTGSEPEFPRAVVSAIRYAITSARSETKRRMDGRWFLEMVYSRRSDD